MRRLAALLCAFAVSFAVGAQSGKVYRIGMLELTPASANRTNLDALLRGLREAGYVEGKNIVIDYRSVEGRPDRFPDLAAELIRAKPDIILTRTAPAALAAKALAPIPIVMISAADPVAAGIVGNLAHPGGTVTGMTTIVSELTAKRVQILRDVVPHASRIGAFIDMSNPTGRRNLERFQRATSSLGLQGIAFDTRDAQTLNRALENAVQQGVSAVLMPGDAVPVANRAAIIAFAAKQKLPVMYTGRDFVVAGGLMSYGVDYPHLYHRAASYVDKIFKGTKPGDLPIEQPTKFEFLINIKTAKAAGIAIPRELLLRVDEVIE